MRGRLAGPISAADLERASGLGKSQLHALFRELTGHAPMTYLRRLRIDAAKALLEDPDLSIKQVALAAGFDDPYHFSRVFSRIDGATQAREINESFAFLEQATGGLELRTFCYPYGGFHSFTSETERLLDAAGCRFSFNVEPRDIAAADLSGRPQALPRYDCNMFPHGAARMGSQAEVA